MSPYKEDNIDFSQGLTYESDEEEKEGAKPAKKKEKMTLNKRTLRRTLRLLDYIRKGKQSLRQREM